MVYKTAVITGHTSGIGKAIFEYFETRKIQTLGFSRSNGCDISTKEGQENIIQACEHADIFINNAYSRFAQVDMLYSLFEKWKDSEKVIINISSNSGDSIKNYVHSYAIEKQALDKAAEQLNFIGSNCKITNIRPGWVKTPRSERIAPQESMLITQDIVSFIDWYLFQPQRVHIPSVTIVPSKIKNHS